MNTIEDLENYIKNKGKKPIKMYIPVNLKKYFPSKTMSNFFSYITLSAQINNGKIDYDLYKDKGQPGWEKLYKLAKSNLEVVDSKVANDKNNTCGDFIVFTKPSKSNNFHKAKIMKIDIIRKNAEINKSNRYLEISFGCDDTLTYTGYYANQHNRFPTPFSGWDVEIFDLNSNPHWSGLLVEEIFKQIPYTGYGTIDTNKLLKRYPPIFAPINS